MSAPEVTPWFEPRQRPMMLREGWYERQYPDGSIRRDWWHGAVWVQRPDYHLACEYEGKWMSFTLPWRGLAQKPVAAEAKVA